MHVGTASAPTSGKAMIATMHAEFDRKVLLPTEQGSFSPSRRRAVEQRHAPLGACRVNISGAISISLSRHVVGVSRKTAALTNLI